MANFDLKRTLRGLLTPFLDHAHRDRIDAAIAKAEKATTGEIHVRVIQHSRGKDMLALAEVDFHRLGLHGHEDRNRVLILLSVLDRRYAIWGDKGIHAKAGHALWEKAASALKDKLSAGKPDDGIVAAIEEIGRELARHYPRGR